MPIPDRLNAMIVAAQLLLIGACIAAVETTSWHWWPLIGLVFAVVGNSTYFSIHEATHGLLFSNRTLNSTAGTLLALFMPASYEMLRRVHLSHHIHNRSDEEVFDLYFESDPAWWKQIQFYGILTGAFWLTMVLSNVVLAVTPMRWLVRASKLDRPSAAVMAYMERHAGIRIRLEAMTAVLVHVGVALWLGNQAIGYAVMYAMFGVSWSSLQYLHHYGTNRDVLRGAKNLRYGRVLDWLLLHHGWHLTHHLRPSVSWRYLPAIADEADRPNESAIAAYVRMWRGASRTSDHVRNQYDGHVERK